jgi:CheY-like chemotaxis protein
MDDGVVAAPSVLVIDDNEIALAAIRTLLEAAGVAVECLPTAIGATQAILRHGIRVVVADLNMPAITGSSLVTMLRKNPRLRDVSVVLISGDPPDSLTLVAAQVGAAGSVSKQDMHQALVPMVQRLLRSASV